MREIAKDFLVGLFAILAYVTLEKLDVFPHKAPACPVVLDATDPWLQARFQRTSSGKADPAAQEGIPDLAGEAGSPRKARRWLWEPAGSGG